MINEAIELLRYREDLSAGLMQAVMEEIMTGKAATDDIVSFLLLLSAKGESVEEITAAALVMRRHALKINTRQKILLDTCGTGGDRKGTFNVSTAVAFVASGSGIAVAKHGNRSVSSCCGSADILEALGIKISLGKEKVESCLDEIGIAFLFAPDFHQAMKFAMPARKQIGKRTIFNILGPLSNPACARHQLIGVFEKGLTQNLAKVMINLNSVHVLVVCGGDGLDEITTTTDSFVSEAKGAELENYTLNPEDFGFQKANLEELKGGGIEDNQRILLDILKGKKGAQRDIVLLNAAAAIYAADKASSIKEGIKIASDSIDSGSALKKLELLREYTREG